MRSRGTPRLANNRLRWVRDYATSKADGRITHAIAQAALEMQEIDYRGLDSQDRKYLETIIRIFHGGPVGVDAVAHTMNTAPDTLEDEVEPFLFAGLVVRTPRRPQSHARSLRTPEAQPARARGQPTAAVLTGAASFSRP